MRSKTDLTALQLQIVMHLANGMTLGEIARMLDRSKSYIAQNANQARYKLNAKTLPQLVSIVIATGQLYWYDGQVAVNNESGPQADDVAHRLT